MAWEVMSQDEVKSVEVGQKIKVNGVETEVVSLYNRFSGDYGFRVSGLVYAYDAATRLALIFEPDLSVEDLKASIVGCEAVKTFFDQNKFEKQVV